MATRPRITIPRSYEDFQPPSNLVQEEDCETLIMDLPGFRKEQVRVQMEDRSGALLISGERPLGNNKWSRFRKDLRVPINCNTNEIQAKFENGVLRIIMPLKVVPIHAPPTTVQTPDAKKPITTPPPPPPPPPPPRSRKPLIETKPTARSQRPEIPKPIWDPLLTAQSPPGQKPISGPKPLPGPLSPPSQKPIIATQTHPPKPAPDSKDSLDKSRESNHPPTAKSTVSQTVGIRSKFDIGQDDTSGKKVSSANIVEKPIELKTDKPENVENQEREKQLKAAQEVKAQTQENASHLVEDCKGGSKRLAMEMDESRQYIVNMVAAVLVVVALWFYTKYTVKSLW